MKEKILEIIDKMKSEAVKMSKESDSDFYAGVVHACAVLKIAIEGIE